MKKFRELEINGHEIKRFVLITEKFRQVAKRRGCFTDFKILWIG